MTFCRPILFVDKYNNMSLSTIAVLRKILYPALSESWQSRKAKNDKAAYEQPYHFCLDCHFIYCLPPISTRDKRYTVDCK